MTKGNYFIITFLMLMVFGMSAQTTDLARIEYLNLPYSKSDNSLQRYRALVQAPIPLDKEHNKMLVVGFEYRYVDINIKDAEDVFALNQNLIGSVQQINTYLGYVWKHNENWRFGVKAGVKIQSDFEGKMINDDLIYQGGIYAVKDMTDNVPEDEKSYRIIAGLSYSNVPGRWYPLPIFNYYKEFHPNWTYTLGVPKSNLRHYLNNNHKDALQVFATLDNVYANIQQNFEPLVDQGEDGKIAESIQTTVGLLGLGYEHYFTEHLLFYGYAAHSVYNDFRFEDGKGKKVYKINTENSPYFRVGLKFKY
ncbi:DUF6268 family outer membrane beta-barrel protein [Aequorivita marina]|uniref:DUF6268 family outer membrane beta-barrel protein n=1 Tax=Aequorivita marina TaxID=3073654 RepID=UPI002874ED82|nr:DUF6268 family outer membrane beta-barrel protein [Aequorivita sp. S2608]MDS1299282.1 DUF6268 family outer membrane beta-barrel protein [Aequorivita sp. S2608]